jgi:hypothetical protein
MHAQDLVTVMIISWMATTSVVVHRYLTVPLSNICSAGVVVAPAGIAKGAREEGAELRHAAHRRKDNYAKAMVLG